MILIFSVLLAVFPNSSTEDWYTLLQGNYKLESSADFLLGSENNSNVLVENLPVVAYGTIPQIPWPSANYVDPLQSGMWGRGTWNISIIQRAFQDSVSISKIGLMQNTKDHSRYVFLLDRPLPLGSSGNFQMIRDDSLRLFSAVIKKNDFINRTMSWEGNNYGWGSWTSWFSERENLYARVGFSRLSSGDRRPEILTGFSMNYSVFQFEGGGSASYVDSTIQGRGLTGLSTNIEKMRLSVYFDSSPEGESFWGGISRPLGSMQISALISKPANENLFQTISVRHDNFNIIGRFINETAVAADGQIRKGIFRGKGAACWNFESDSLSVSSWMLLGVDWYRARFEAGPRIRAGFTTDGITEEKLDLLVGFTLATFSFAGAVEDMIEETERSWSFGITWFFTDQSPVRPIGEEEVRNEN